MKFLNKLNFLNLVYFVIVIFCFRSFLFSSGYFFSLDFSYGPHIGLYDGLYYPNQIIWIYLQKVISFIVPSFIVQKIFVFGFFITSYFSIKKLLSYFTKSDFIIFLLSIFFLFNPFVYPRFEQGQFYILYAYAFIPLLLYYLFNNKILKSFLIFALILTFSPHFIFIVGLIYLIYFVLNYKTINYKELFFGILLVFLINFYWIFLLYTSTNIENFTLKDVLGFASNKVYYSNIYFEILSLNGFWGDSFSRYIISTSDFKYTFLGFLVLNLFFGSLLIFKQKDKIGYLFLILFGVGFILSLGLSQKNIFYTFNELLFNHFPFYIGLREVNKFSALLVIGYIYFILKTLIFIQKLEDEFSKNIFYLIFTIFITINNFTFYMIFPPQFKAYNIPNNYMKIDKLLYKSNKNCDYKIQNKSQKCYNTLVLPRHQSISFKFIGKTITNPSGYFFGEEVLFGDNIEMGNIYSQSNRKESKIMESYFKNGFFKTENSNTKNFLNDLKGLGISQIILYKEGDYNRYELFLDSLLLQKTDFEEISLYKIKD